MAELSRWACNEGSGLIARDSISGRDLTLLSPSGPTWGPGVVIYDGVNDYSIRSSVDFGLNNTTELSVSFTLKTSDASGRIIQKEISDGVNTFRIQLTGSGIILFALDGFAIGQSPQWEIASAVDFSTTKRVTFTFKVLAGDATDGIVYITSSPVTTNFTAFGYFTSFFLEEVSSNFVVAARPVSFTDPLAGEVGDIRVFNTQLTSGEVTALGVTPARNKIIKPNQAVKRASYW